MRARDLAQPFPCATLDADAYEAALQMASERRPGLIVVNENEQPVAILPGTQVLNFLIPQYVAEGKSYLTIGIGCTGGRHRSVAMAEALKKGLSGLSGIQLRVKHRDIAVD